jgi:hypothetical protein
MVGQGMKARIGLAVAALLWMQGLAIAASWESTVTSSSSPSFPAPRPLRARYGFSWSGFPCGTVESKLSKPGGDQLQLNMTARTIGLARALLNYDATHVSTVDASALRPIAVRQIENDRGKKIVTELAFNSNGVVSKETESPENQTKTRQFNFPRLFDLQSAMLYIRSQPLPERSVQRIVVYPATSPYLATVTVLGRERVTVPAGTYNAIKFDLQLNRIKDGELLPHKKFRRATAWLSDDPDRVMLKIEAQVFIGTVFCHLQSVDFENPKS